MKLQLLAVCILAIATLTPALQPELASVTTQGWTRIPSGCNDSSGTNQGLVGCHPGEVSMSRGGP